jgi:asparagine synthase (glutamine-hydrolysing)
VRTYFPDGRQDSWNYWQLQIGESGDTASFDEIKAGLLAVLRRAVQRRMIADVPVGVLLSGGLDSSLIVGLLAEQGQEALNTFSVGFETVGDTEGNEFRYPDLVAQTFGTSHHKLEFSTRTLLDNLPGIIGAMSQPMVSHDNIGFFLLSREVSKHVKVVQSGQGADEVFGGYHWYPPMMKSEGAVTDYLAAFSDRDFEEFCQAVEPAWVTEDFARLFVEGRFATNEGRESVDKALHLDTTTMLVDDPVKRVDNMTMAFGLEARVPFLDHEVLEYAASIPSRFKVDQGGKYVLKEAAREVIPAEVIDRPKGYFPVPELTYIRGRVYDYVQETLNSSRALNRGLFKRDYVDQLLEAPEDHIIPLNGSKLWQVALLEAWLQANGL